MRKIGFWVMLGIFVVLVSCLAAAVRIPLADQKGANLGLTVTLVTVNVTFVVGVLIFLVDRKVDR